MEARETASTPFAGCLVRLFWMVGGIIALLFLSLSIVRSGGLSAYDPAFAAVAAAMILVRFLDVRFLNGETADGHPATLRDWRRYAVGVAVCSFGCWLVLHGVAWLVNQ